MTKDRPRNRRANGPKSGGFRPGKPDGQKPFGNRARSQRLEREPADSGGQAKRFTDKPRRLDKPRGDVHGSADHGKPGGAPLRAGGRQAPRRTKWERREAIFEENGEVWIWGAHAAAAALANPKRQISSALLTRNAAQRAGLDPDALPKFSELLDPKDMDTCLAPGAVHQGIAVRARQIDGPDISEAAMRPERPLVILDQVTDPQNVGAVYRSAAAFGVAGVVMQTRNAPLLGGALAKAAAGAIEIVDDIRAVNLSRAIDALTDAGWKVIGLEGSADQTIDEAFAGPEPLAIVLGAEGAGIRPAVAKACTGLARIPMGEGMESLNVSNAAAIAFYVAMRRHGAAPPPAKASQRPAGEVTGAEDTD